MKIKLFVVLVTLSNFLLAQENFTLKANDENINLDYLLLPFDPNYYMSDMDKEIGEYNKMTSQEIRQFFRTELDLRLFVSIKNYKKIQSLLMKGGNNTIKDLSFVLEGVKYEYVPLEAGLLSTNEKKTKKALGQLGKKADNQLKYMSAAVANKAVFEELVSKNKAKHVISINQFEIKNNFNDQLDIQHNVHTRKINVHYTILDKQGKIIYGGIASSEFANNVLDVNKIVQLNFDKIATDISGHLPLN